MLLDLTGHTPLDKQIAIQLNRIAERERVAFTKMIEDASRQYGKNMDWWATELACRNTWTSKLFLYCCYLSLVIELIEKQQNVKHIMVDSVFFAGVIRKHVRNARFPIKVSVKITPCDYLKIFAAPFYRYAVSIYRLTVKGVLLNVIKPRQTHVNPNNGILIDTFIYNSSFNPEYTDRHYPNIERYVSDDVKKRLFFVPHFYKIKNWVTTILNVRRENTKFLLKEDYFKLIDYFYAATHSLRSLRFVFRPYVYHGMNIKPLILQEILSRLGSYTAINAVLNYRFAKRLRENKIEISHVIDWFENQSIDHGFNAGFQHSYPCTPLTGYQGFIAPRHYLCAFPTEQEQKHKVLPKRIAVMGQQLIEPIKAFCKELDVFAAPAFRYHNLWYENDHTVNPHANIILAALPVDHGESINIIQNIVSVARNAHFRQIHGTKRIIFKIKPHPSVLDDAVTAIPSDCQHCLNIVKGDLSALLESTDLLISSGSSACLESLAKGVPVIVMGNMIGLTQNPIPSVVPSEIYRICYSEEDLLQALTYFLANRESHDYKMAGSWVRDAYFQPVNKKSVCTFLDPGNRIPQCG